jgi:hypothetical protein
MSTPSRRAVSVGLRTILENLRGWVRSTGGRAESSPIGSTAVKHTPIHTCRSETMRVTVCACGFVEPAVSRSSTDPTLEPIAALQLALLTGDTDWLTAMGLLTPTISEPSERLQGPEGQSSFTTWGHLTPSNRSRPTLSSEDS